MCFVNLCLRLYFGFLDCLVYDLLCSDFCVTELSFIAFFQLFSICSVVCGRIQIIFNVLLAFVQQGNNSIVMNYYPRNGLANTRTIAMTIAIIGIDSIRPIATSMLVKSVPAISG